MKKKILITAFAAAILFPVSSYALFGEDIAYLIQLINIGRQTYQQTKQVVDNVKGAAAFFKSPDAMKQVLLNGLSSAQAAIQQQSNGHNLVTLHMYDDGLRSMLTTAQQAHLSADQMTTENAALLSVMQFEAIQAKVAHDNLATSLQFQADKARYEQTEGYGLGSCISCTIRPVIP